MIDIKHWDVVTWPDPELPRHHQVINDNNSTRHMTRLGQHTPGCFDFRLSWFISHSNLTFQTFSGSGVSFKMIFFDGMVSKYLTLQPLLGCGQKE